nr:hypothetical protein [Cupriavidus pinatubonensis]
MLLGIHSARLDVGSRDFELDEALGLNSAWYAEILLPLTKRPFQKDPEKPVNFLGELLTFGT